MAQVDRAPPPALGQKWDKQGGHVPISQVTPQVTKRGILGRVWDSEELAPGSGIHLCAPASTFPPPLPHPHTPPATRKVEA